MVIPFGSPSCLVELGHHHLQSHLKQLCRKLQLIISVHPGQVELNGKEKSVCLENQIQDLKANPKLHLGRMEEL